MWKLFGKGKTLYGENGMQTGQDIVSADQASQLSSVAPGAHSADAGGAVVGADAATEPAEDSPFPEEHIPGEELHREHQEHQRRHTPGFIDQPVLSGPDAGTSPPSTQTAAGEPVPIMARATAILTRRVFGVPVWVLAAAAAAWWLWRRRQ